MLPQIKNNLKELGFKPNEINVYIASTQLGEAKASEIAKKVNLPRTTVISILEKLSNDNYISTHKYKGKTFYWVESPKLIKENLEHKVKIADDLQNLLSDLYRTESQFPFAKVYDTKSSIKKYIEKTLFDLNKKSTIYTIDNTTKGNYRKIFSDDYSKNLLEIKQKKQIQTKTLITFGTYKKIDPYKLQSQNIIIKELPPEINFSASLWIIEKKLVLFSGQIPFLIEINHSLIVESMKSMYNYFWKISEAKN